MRNRKIITVSTLIIILCILYIFNAFAHSGRTDSSGGHWNRSNGTYHYHCGGYPAHSHSGGVCPYKKPKSYSSSTSSISSSTKYDDGYEVGYDKGYDKGCEDGYIEGRNDGYDEGYDDAYDKGYEDGYNARIEEAKAETEKEIQFLLILGLVIIIIVAIAKFIKKHRKE